MKYLELSENDVREESKRLANKIEGSYKPDLVIFIAKGSYYIGDEISKYFKIPLFEIFAVREKNKLKEIISPILKIIPKSIKKQLREMEVNSGIHNKNINRKVYMDEKFKKQLKEYKEILVVDDSVDTGNTIIEIVKYLKKYDLKIKIASLNVFEMSKEKIEIDYYNYENTMLNGPWSKDSMYYKKFMEDYKIWKK